MGSSEKTPWLEHAAAAIGGCLTAALVTVLALQAAQGAGRPPALSVDVERVLETEGGFIVEVRAYNRSRAAAAGVILEGRLEGERSEATLDYVPGRSSRKAGLFFDHDPRRADLSVRALGYIEP